MIMMTMIEGSSSGIFLLLLLLSSGMSLLESVVWKAYEYFDDHYTWQDAQSFCRSLGNGTDLATIYKQSDADSLESKSYLAWTGLHRKAIELWHTRDNWFWPDGQEHHGYWAENEPHYSDKCAFVRYRRRKFYGVGCEESLFFICQMSDISTPSYFNYIFIPQSKNWSEARQYCKEKFQDLAALKDYSDLDFVVNQRDFPIWIGLHRDGETWKWSKGLSDYRNWTSGEQQNNGDCVSISSVSKEMATQKCSARFPFICLKDNLLLVKENKTWEEALEHCRALKSSRSDVSYELVSVKPGEQHDYVINRVKEASTEQVWAGLRFLAGHWLWMNSANVLYSNLPTCPPAGQHCGALSKNDTGSVETTDCSQKLNFLCYSTS